MSEWRTWSFDPQPEDPRSPHGDEGGGARPSGEDGDAHAGGAESGGTEPAGSGHGSADPGNADPGDADPGNADPAVPTVPAPDEAALRWSDEVRPFSLDRLAHVMESDGFPVGRSEFEIATTVEDLGLRLHREPADVPWLQVLSRVSLPEAGAATPFDLQQVANTWNTTHLQPTVYADRAEGEWRFSMACRFHVGEGLSDRQVHLMVRRAVIVSLQAVRELPAMVTPLPGE